MQVDVQALAAKKVEERNRCKKDKLFLAEVMGWDFVPEVHQELFDQFITFDPKQPWVHQSTTKNRLILWPRGHYKSTAIQVEIVQMILNFPDITILIMRGGLSVTRTLLKELKAYFTGANSKSRLRELFPEFCADRLGNGSEFTTPARQNKGIAQATVTVASPNALTTSQHYDVMFFDDLIHAKNYRNPKLLEKAEQDFSDFAPLLNPGGYRYVTGTRYAHGDLYEKITFQNTNKEWTVSVKTCWADDGVGVRFPQQVSKRDPNKLIGFTRAMLEGFAKEDAEKFSSNYLNRPASTGSQKFSKELIESLFVDDDKVLPLLSGSVLFVDLASSENEKTADDSVVLCGRTDASGYIYLADFMGGVWSEDALAAAIISMSLKHRPIRIMFENTASCKYFMGFLRLLCQSKNIILPVDKLDVDNQNGAKYVRIAVVAGLMKAHRIRILRSCAANPRWDILIKQFEQWPGGRNKHDDYPDTFALMVRELGNGVLALPLNPPPNDNILEMIRQSERQEAWEQAMAPGPDDAVSSETCGDYFSD